MTGRKVQRIVLHYVIYAKLRAKMSKPDAGTVKNLQRRRDHSKLIDF